MTDKTLSLGERILLATRLAVEEHLLQGVKENMQSERQVRTGGAGLDQVTDDSLASARGRVIFAWGAATRRRRGCMNYGLYLSATGVLANTYRQDVIANNLANSETVGFKRHLATFQERPTESATEGRPDLSDPMLDNIGGGFLVSPTVVDTTQGEMETTGNNLDAAIFGQGYFAVDDHGKTQLTRAGQFMLNRDGDLIMTNANGQHVLDADGKPIQLPGLLGSKLEIQPDGQITHQGQPVARLGLFDVPDPTKLMKKGQSLFDYPDLAKSLKPADAQVQSGTIERSNVDPTTELTQLMETQRALEANANMIRYQDAAMAKLVNEVGKIG